MKSVRNLIAYFVAFALAAFAVPGFAQNVKYFTLGFTTPDSSNATVQTTEIYLKFANIETGNSSFNAVSVTAVPSGGATVRITRLQAVGLPGGALGTPLYVSDTLWRLGDLPPTKKGQSVTVKATVQISATACSGAKIRWDGGAWTGSVSTPSTDFVQSGASPETTVGGCGWSVTGSDSVAKGKAKQVTLTIRNAATSPIKLAYSSVSVGAAPAGLVKGAVSEGTGWPIAAGSSGTILIDVSAPCDASGAGGTWSNISATGFGSPSSNDSNIAVAGTCSYNYTISSSGPGTTVKGGSVTGVVVTITNDSNSSAPINDITLTPPAGVQVSGTPTKSGFPIVAGGSGTITMNVTAPCNLAGEGGKWTTASISPTTFTTPTSNTSSFAVTGNCDLFFSKLPTSFASGVESEVKVQFVDGGGTKVGSSSGSTVFMLVASGSCSLPGGTQGTLSGGEATIKVTLTGDPSNCTLKAYATIDGKDYEETTSTFKLFADVISCNPSNPTAAIIDWSTVPPPTLPAITEQFDGSPGTNSIGAVEYYKGARGSNDKSGGKTQDCVDLPYTIENNVKGSSDDTTSVPGKTIPKNGAALFWDETLQPNATFRTITTFSDEWTAAAGWIAKRTKICLDDSCATKVELRVCLGTDLNVASMPKFVATDFANGTGYNGYLVGDPMPACIVAEVFRTVIPDYSTVPPSACTAASKPGPNSACIRTTSELLIVGDPAWDR